MLQASRGRVSRVADLSAYRSTPPPTPASSPARLAGCRPSRLMASAHPALLASVRGGTDGQATGRLDLGSRTERGPHSPVTRIQEPRSPVVQRRAGPEKKRRRAGIL